VAYSHDDQLLIADLSTGFTSNAPSPISSRLVRTPAVSPDGRRIVFQVFRDGGWLFDVASGRMQRILDDPTAEEFAWQPGGRRVAYHSRRDGQWRIWLMTLPDVLPAQ
jgi:Tol biopolymer transport system component